MQLATAARWRGLLWLALSVCLACFVLPDVAEAKKGPKVDICHVPPGNPTNFHTKSVSENAVPAHEGHGDIVVASCEEAGPIVCDDQDACTVDEFVEATLECVPEADRPGPDCDDGDPATVDFCDDAQGGCVNLSQFSCEGVDCDDGDPSTLDICDEGAGSCLNPSVVSAESQDVSTNGTAPLQIVLKGNELQGLDLMFSIESVPGAGSLGPPTPIVPDPVSSCSETSQTCTVDADCPAGETCEQAQPPVMSATVVYTASASETADSFEFQAANPGGNFAIARVNINGTSEAEGGSTAIDSVEALDGSAETLAATPVVVKLLGDAPETVSLTFTSVNPDAGFQGTLGPLTQGSGSPQRTATVSYDPAAFLGTESFSFEVCDAAAPSVCDTATMSVATDEPKELAPDQVVETNINTPVAIDLGI